MRTLIALSIVQTVLLGIIGIRVIALEARTEELANAPAPQTYATAPTPSNYAASLTADEVRAIIREEIAALPPQHTLLAAYSNNAPASRPVISSEDASRQKANVQRDLDVYISRGKIGEAEMAELQNKIGELPAAERREMLSKLTKALNTGKLKGQL